MKKIIQAFCFVFLFPFFLSAQKKNFEGVITYSISFEKSGLPPDAITMLDGAESIVYIKGDKRRVDMKTIMQSTTSVMDDKAKTVLMTMEVMGHKYLVRMNEADLNKEKETAPATSIIYLDEQKEIAGYACKKAEVTLKETDGSGKMFIVYYTDAIPTNSIKNAFEGLKGFPMQYDIAKAGVNMSFTAKRVTKEIITDSTFELSKEGCKETTLFELQNEMMGGSQ
jgi:GLPGLI family protein